MPPKKEMKTEQDLEALVHNRGMALRNVTRIQTILKQAEVDHTELTPAQVKVYQRSVENANAEFTRLHHEIVALSQQENREEQDNYYLQFVDLHEEVSVVLESWLEKFTVPPAQQPQPTGNQQPLIIQPSLPRAIPTFDGRYEQWEKFKVMFKDVVDKGNESDRIKLYHLEKALVGDAAGLIDVKTITDGNYAHAWKLLDERYSDHRRLIDRHLASMLGVKKLAKESYSELRSLVETFNGHVENLKFLGNDFADVAEYMVVFLITRALDDETKKLWEATMKKGELPVYDETIEFLKERVSVLERCQTSSENSQSKYRPPTKPNLSKPFPSKINTATTSAPAEQRCEFCADNHFTFKCPIFNELSVSQRIAKVKEKNVCFNCLRRGHRVSDCSSKKSCLKCNRRHHSLLHLEEMDQPPKNSSEIKQLPSPAVPVPKSASAAQVPDPPVPACKPSTSGASTNAAHSNVPVKPTSQVFLLTALVNVMDQDLLPHTCRALLDNGSQVSFITQSLANALRMSMNEVSVPITGIGSAKSTVKQMGTVQVRSRCNNFILSLSCLVSPKITGPLPSFTINIDTWNIPEGIQLADPTFHRANSIDMLIGMDHFYDIMKSGYMKLSDDLPGLHDSHFGWLVGGNYCEGLRSGIVLRSLTVSTDPVNKLVQKFWEIESVAPELVLTTDMEKCEQHFLATHRRDETGRYVVQLPLKDSVEQLADSRFLALRRFYLLEAKLARNPDLKAQYDAFIEEYESLNHCQEVQESNDPPGLRKWYLPHHAVLRPSNSTTKCRVVFDASAKVHGYSLNDVMMVGPTVQADIETIILRFRTLCYVFSADVGKMYRQFLVDRIHTPMQRIFWRTSPTQKLRVLELTTVTYGTATAPFLATRALLQLARDEKKKFPLAARVIEENCYVDNALFGSNDFQEAEETQYQLNALLQSGGMHLHKWSSNDERLLVPIPPEDRDTFVDIGDSGANNVIKTLGLLWNPTTDEFVFLASPPASIEIPTKRQVLSTIAKVYDPLGLISPVVVIAKILMQRLWISKLAWDDKLDSDLCAEYKSFIEALPIAEQIRIPRLVVSPEAVAYELHGFADASKKAYGACVYIRSLYSNGTATMKLISSKSKIAPISPVTIPRLELLAALLLCRLINKIQETLKMKFTSTNLWTDSQVVLAWLRKPPSSLTEFVRNRVAEIVSHDQFVWRYVRTSANPADTVSRGQSSTELARNDMWWNGPSFLRSVLYEAEVPDLPSDDEIPEMKPTVSVHIVMKFDEFPVLTKFESFRKTQRIVAYVLRFLSNCRKKKEDRVITPYPTIPELRGAMMKIVGAVQEQEFSREIDKIKAGENNHRLVSLNPFLDNGLLRVGGRIRHAQLPYKTKHQLILPDKSPVIRSLLVATHRENMHVGVSSVITILRQQFWLLNAKSTVRKVIRNCVHCFRLSPTTIDQQMGDLPSYRVNEEPVFAQVGVDYAGPIFVKQTARKATPVKSYICIFVCMVTKAIHLEAVENLSTEAFLAAFQRFVSRKGTPHTVYSDNGTNFIGAKSELHELYVMFQTEATQKKLFELCQTKEIAWRTIPPRSPHFGGLWEAGVKSVKSVLKKVYQAASLTIFELYTLLCQVEAILNSRPLYAHSNDPQDPEALTPAHLMIGRPLHAVPEPSYTQIPANRLSRWQYVQQLREQFWTRWSKEYLTELQVRGKWTQKRVNVKPGLVVLLKEENIPPQNWKLGRVVSVYPGADGLVRVVDVKTKSGTYKRAIHKLAPLPILDNLTPSDPNVAVSTLPGGRMFSPCTGSGLKFEEEEEFATATKTTNQSAAAEPTQI